MAHQHTATSATPFAIPEKHAKIFAYLSEFEAKSLNKMVESLAQLGARAFPAPLFESILEEFSDAHHTAENLSRAIQALHNTRQTSNLSEAEFVEAAVAATVANADVESDPIALRALFVNLLSLRDVGLSVKATRAVMDTERHMHDVVIYTDLRPLFDAKGSEVDALLIMHTLKIDFHDGSDDREFYIYVDDEDIAKLEDALSRAKRKAIGIRALAKGSNLRILGDGA